MAHDENKNRGIMHQPYMFIYKQEASTPTKPNFHPFTFHPVILIPIQKNHTYKEKCTNPPKFYNICHIPQRTPHRMQTCHYFQSTLSNSTEVWFRSIWDDWNRKKINYVSWIEFQTKIWKKISILTLNLYSLAWYSHQTPKHECEYSKRLYLHPPLVPTHTYFEKKRHFSASANGFYEKLIASRYLPVYYLHGLD